MTKKKPKFTKRGISSVVPALYDPAGLIQPYIVEGEICLQKTWTHRDANGNSLRWDDPLPKELEERFISWTDQLEKIHVQNIPDIYFLRSIPHPNKMKFIYISSATRGTIAME